jgi:hypothetical protein
VRCARSESTRRSLSRLPAAAVLSRTGGCFGVCALLVVKISCATAEGMFWGMPREQVAGNGIAVGAAGAAHASSAPHSAD